MPSQAQDMPICFRPSSPNSTTRDLLGPGMELKGTLTFRTRHTVTFGSDHKKFPNLNAGPNCWSNSFKWPHFTGLPGNLGARKWWGCSCFVPVSCSDHPSLIVVCAMAQWAACFGSAQAVWVAVWSAGRGARPPGFWSQLSQPLIH